MTLSIAEAILQGSLRLRKAGVPEARREAGSLVAHALGQDRSFILTHAEDPLREEQAAQLFDWLERRSVGEPLQYITGRQEFFGLDFEVTREVLIPRPETELLVETALRIARESAGPPLICDVGTGSGCIVISLLHELRENSGVRAVAIDASPAALEVARRNAARHSLSDRIDFVISDCFSELNSDASARSLFDLIVSNPPYIAENAFSGLQREVRDFEPRAALAAGPDGLAIIRRLLVESVGFLKAGGHFLFEIGFDQGAAVERLLDPKIWKLLDIHKDLQGIPRTVALQKVS
jgi:release factor glutamine methyltransferase